MTFTVDLLYWVCAYIYIYIYTHTQYNKSTLHVIYIMTFNVDLSYCVYISASCATRTDFPDSRHLSLSTITPSRSSRLHPVSVQSYMYVRIYIYIHTHPVSIQSYIYIYIYIYIYTFNVDLISCVYIKMLRWKNTRSSEYDFILRNICQH